MRYVTKVKTIIATLLVLLPFLVASQTKHPPVALVSEKAINMIRCPTHIESSFRLEIHRKYVTLRSDTISFRKSIYDIRHEKGTGVWYFDFRCGSSMKYFLDANGTQRAFIQHKGKRYLLYLSEKFKKGQP